MSEAKSFFDVIAKADPPKREPSPAVKAEATSRAGGVILGRECDDVANTGEGGRNDRLNRAAFNIGQLVAGGEIDEREAVDALTFAGQVAGLADREILATIRSGMRAGAENPRALRKSAWEPKRPQVDRPAIPAQATTEAVEQATGLPEAPSLAARMIDGASFILDAPTEIPTVWGSDAEILWASGEALMIVGGNGVGKTTLASQVVKARLGLRHEVLGLPVVQGGKRVLYLAMDRPAQVSRALRRLFSDEDRDALADRMLFWKGPPPLDLAKHTDLLLSLCEDADADTVVVDSLKDAAIGLSEDEVGAGWNRARQAALAAGIEVLELHHNVKRGANGQPPSSIADVYGSAWLTAGVGSVVFLHGEPGDPIVAMRHLKQPAEEVGPWKVQHDHERGMSSVFRGVDLVVFIKARGQITVRQAAQAIFDAEKPSEAQLEKARRRLDSLVRATTLQRHDGVGDRGQATYSIAFSAGVA